jgi:hypothetical protein
MAGLLVAAGLLLLVAGLLVQLGGPRWLGWLGWLGWFGHLPGDIRIERDNLHVYAPISSMLLISLLLSLLWALLRRLL